jgi:signal transduction histidine kinase
VQRPQPLDDPAAAIEQLTSARQYRQLKLFSAVSIALVAVIPLIIMTGINYHQYQQAFHEELVRPISQITTNAERSMEFFISERLSALSLVVHEESFDELQDARRLQRLLSSMKRSFGGFIDLGLIDSQGRQLAYAGPYHLAGKSYEDQPWFHEVHLRDVFVSEVFRGYRDIPHFVIAVRHESEDQGAYVLRATIDTEMIDRQVLTLHGQPSSDAFIINREGVLQTPSRFYGDVLEPWPLPVPTYSEQTVVEEIRDVDGGTAVCGYAYIDRSPFIMMFVSRPGMQPGWLSLRRNLVLFTSASVVLILVVVAWGSKYMTDRIRLSDQRRAILFHNLEYTNKMAAIGRLGAGVAHEINNPLAIIDEKAGLLKDLLTLSEEMPPREKLLAQIDSILKSVERCSRITHRLLGFAKHMDVRNEIIDLEALIREVLGFLDKEAGYRNVQIDFDIPPDLPNVQSDRGQLQQVFLNIINNAFAAVPDDGRLRISMARIVPDRVLVRIADNGQGIPEEHLPHVFEPFFTTKKGSGTGLGLSITYGIVQKLGGTISVQSKVGEGTCFAIELPVYRDSGGTHAA